MKMILIMGLPGAGKTTLANELAKLIKAKRLNADEIRKAANDWDFSEEGRKRQAKRMSDKALKLIKSHPKINKVSYIGWSQGGVGPILSHFKRVTDLVDNGRNIFDSSIAIYPYCGFTFDKGSVLNHPLLMLTGQDDDLTPERACINIYEKFNRDDGNINLISLEGARHGYDNPFLFFGFEFENYPSLHIINDDCTLTVSDNGEIVSLSNQKITGPRESAAKLSECSTKGVFVKYSPHATEVTFKEIIKFLEKI